MNTAASPAGASARFFDLGVPKALAVALERQGITEAFPVQAATLPDSLAGRDVCGKAPTGSGKTLAFALAVLSRIEAAPRVNKRGRRHPSALVLVPTRELASQIEKVMAPLAQVVNARVASVYGGVGYGKQISAFRKGVDVVIACPGRLADLVNGGSVDLSFVETVVVDEADRMADMGFLPEVRRLIDRTGEPRQTLLFSATLEGPVDKLIRDYQHDPVRHDIESAAEDIGDVTHHFWGIDHEDRVAVTSETVAAHGPAIIFCRTKRGADRLSQRLGRFGLQSAAIHGDRSQNQRERALASFRSGRTEVLVATDVAARGIHVDAVPLVINYDPPQEHTDYVHRAGRTGRAGADGIIVSLVQRDQKAKTGAMQRKLGLPNGVTAPDVAGLADLPAQPKYFTPYKPEKSTKPGKPNGYPKSGKPNGHPKAAKHGKPVKTRKPAKAHKPVKGATPGGPAKRRRHDSFHDGNNSGSGAFHRRPGAPKRTNRPGARRSAQR